MSVTGGRLCDIGFMDGGVTIWFSPVTCSEIIGRRFLAKVGDIYALSILAVRRCNGATAGSGLFYWHYLPVSAPLFFLVSYGRR